MSASRLRGRRRQGRSGKMNIDDRTAFIPTNQRDLVVGNARTKNATIARITRFSTAVHTTAWSE